jgi:hypothetical protein
LPDPDDGLPEDPWEQSQFPVGPLVEEPPPVVQALGVTLPYAWKYGSNPTRIVLASERIRAAYRLGLADRSAAEQFYANPGTARVPIQVANPAWWAEFPSKSAYVVLGCEGGPYKPTIYRSYRSYSQVVHLSAGGSNSRHRDGWRRSVSRSFPTDAELEAWQAAVGYLGEYAEAL